MQQIRHARPSVVHNTETFLQKKQSVDIQSHAASSYLRSVYRARNLELSKILKSSSIGDNDEIKKVAKNLNCCSAICIVKNQNEVVRTSKKCRSKFCAQCARARSKKLQTRFDKVIRENFNDFTKYRFYFLTVTLKHREGDYLSEFKGFQNKLIRSKLFKDSFLNYGIIQAFENVIKDNDYHIHSHNLIMCDPLKVRVNLLEKELQNKWNKITGDSIVLRLDLIGKGLDFENDPDSLFTISKEILKYSTKIGDVRNMTPGQKEMLAKWVVSSKGKNFTNCRGKLRGFGITACTSELDEKSEDVQNDYCTESTYHLTGTSSIKYNHSIKKNSHFIKADRVLANVEIVNLGKDSVDITKYIHEAAGYLKNEFDESDVSSFLDHILIESIEAREVERNKFEYDNKMKRSRVHQMNMF